MHRLLLMFFCLSLCSCGIRSERYDLTKTKTAIGKLNDNNLALDTSELNGLIRLLKVKNTEMLKFSDSILITERREGHIVSVWTKTFTKFNSMYELVERDRAGSVERRMQILRDYAEIQEQGRIDKYFDYYNTYYISGRIKSRWIRSRFGFFVGKRYNYDEHGEILSVVDTDKDFTFGYERVLKFYLRKWKGLTDYYYKSPVYIDKDSLAQDNNGKIWRLGHVDKKSNLTDVYYLDGASGKVIKKFRVDGRKQI